MSVSAHELERAALLKKDRDQLLAIATAMGRKPPARARKADIIDLIMELAGMPAAGSTPMASTDSGVPSDDAGGQAPEGGREVAPAEQAVPAEQAEQAAPAEQAVPAEQASPAEQTIRDELPVGTGAEPGGPGDTDDRSRVRPVRVGADAGSAERSQRVRPSRDASERPPRAPGQARFVFSPEDPAPDLESGVDGSDRARSGMEEASRAPQRDVGPGRRPGMADRTEQTRTEQTRTDRTRGEQTSGHQARGGEVTSRDSNGASDGVEGDDDRDDEEVGRRRRRRGKNRERIDERPVEEPTPADAVEVSGYLDLRDEGYGFLRVKGYLPTRDDVYVPSKFIRQTGLRKGDHLAGASRPAGRGEKNPALLRIDSVNGQDPESTRDRPRFDDLTPIYPDSRLRLELADDPENLTARVIDLIAPIGKGQRGLIVAPPKTGKTTLLKLIAHSMQRNHPEVDLIVLLVDERPEEVTDMERFVGGDVVASTFDRPADEHCQIAEMTVERAKRMVELGADVMVILDGMTRLARAYGQTMAAGRSAGAGIDSGTIHPTKRLFGAARNMEGGGSLTILATCEAGTGSRIDEAILEEFASTENMELRLDATLAEKRMFPAIDVRSSSTRQEELLVDEADLSNVWKLRSLLAGPDGDADPVTALAVLTSLLEKTPTNAAVLAEVGKGR